MNVHELFGFTNMQRLFQVHRERNGGTPSIDVLAWVRILREKNQQVQLIMRCLELHAEMVFAVLWSLICCISVR